MNTVIIEQIVNILLQAVEAGIKYGPAIIADLKLTYALATSGTAITPEQQAQADTAVANAHRELQDKLGADIAEDAAVTTNV